MYVFESCVFLAFCEAARNKNKVPPQRAEKAKALVSSTKLLSAQFSSTEISYTEFPLPSFVSQVSSAELFLSAQFSLLRFFHRDFGLPNIVY